MADKLNESLQENFEETSEYVSKTDIEEINKNKEESIHDFYVSESPIGWIC